ncbi:interleukin-like EMT inducer domain-containing protein [Vibrio owensii]|uniref:interleukin-like EMT inducer domain-containing protein n=1 Tax=Vibrio harveyi group TaxID=717610 RepID=UPI003CC5FB18
MIKINKYILTALLLSSAGSSVAEPSYLMKVPQKFAQEWSESSQASEWVNSGDPFGCSDWLPNQNTANIDQQLTQSMTCHQKQKQTITTSKTEAFSGKVITETSEKEQTIQVSSSRTVNGTRHYFQLKSCGLYGCSRGGAYINYDGKKYTAYRSWSVVVVHPSTKKVISHNRYDVYGSTSAAASMRDKLKSIPNGYLVLINTWDEPANNSSYFSNYLVSYFGATRTTFGSRSSYYIVGYKNGQKLAEGYRAGERNSITSSVKYIY